jgi:hypothetical protein
LTRRGRDEEQTQVEAHLLRLAERYLPPNELADDELNGFDGITYFDDLHADYRPVKRSWDDGLEEVSVNGDDLD